MLPLRRSLVPTPGNVQAKVEKARSFKTDVLMLDLEDGVPDSDAAKELARGNVVAALRKGTFAAREIAIRINSPRSPWFMADATAVASLEGATIVVPMIHDASDMIFVERTLTALGVASTRPVILLIETPAAVLNLQEIVKVSPRTNGLIAGTLDYAAEMTSLAIAPFAAARNSARKDEDLTYMRQHVLAVARAHNLSALDAMRPGLIADLDAFRADAEQARWLGFDGVDFYHPAFIAIANDVFTPSPDEREWARRVLSTNADPGADAPASVKVDGRVILPQHRAMARRIEAIARQIADG